MTARYVRVALHPNLLDHPNYPKLHEKMRKAGFVRVAIFGGAKHFLPTGTYRKSRVPTAKSARKLLRSVTSW